MVIEFMIKYLVPLPSPIFGMIIIFKQYTLKHSFIKTWPMAPVMDVKKAKYQRSKQTIVVVVMRNYFKVCFL